MEFNLKYAYRSLRIIYFSLITGVVLFQLATLFMNDWIIPEFKESLDPLNIISIAMLLFIPLFKMLSDRHLKQIKAEDPIKDKFVKLQSALIVRWAAINGVALFSIVGFMMLQDGKQLVVFLLSLVAFFMANPTKEKVSIWAKLSQEENKRLID